ncbi:unnamed protein product [Trichobilharzia regenti]|nr:unnamed protein product [Trichobilharzia regenti]
MSSKFSTTHASTSPSSFVIFIIGEVNCLIRQSSLFKCYQSVTCPGYGCINWSVVSYGTAIQVFFTISTKNA